MTEKTTFRRKSRKIPKPNPLFEQWISEWLKEATEKNLEVRHGFRRVSQLSNIWFLNYW